MQSISADPPLELRAAGPKGLGVYTIDALPPGVRVLRFAGPLLHPDEVTEPHRAILTGGNRFLGPSGEIDDFVNHSCDPNTGLRWWPGRLELWSLEPIRAGDELTFDYSTCMVDEPGLDPCLCGARRCRGQVVAFRDLPRLIQKRYLRLDAVPEFVGRTARSTARAGTVVDQARATAARPAI